MPAPAPFPLMCSPTRPNKLCAEFPHYCKPSFPKRKEFFEKNPKFFCLGPQKPKGADQQAPDPAPAPLQPALRPPDGGAEEQKVHSGPQGLGAQGIDLHLSPGGRGVQQGRRTCRAPEQQVPHRRPHPAPPPQAKKPQQIIEKPQPQTQDRRPGKDHRLLKGKVAKAQGGAHRNSRLQKPPASWARSS